MNAEEETHKWYEYRPDENEHNIQSIKTKTIYKKSLSIVFDTV